MKKLLLVAVAVGMTMSGFAQYDRGNGITLPTQENVKVAEDSRFGNNKTDILEWWSYADEQRELGGRLFSATTLFIDTTVWVEYSTGYGAPNFYNIGQVFDPKGPLWFSKTIKLDSNDAYTVDSIAVPYRYERYQTGAPDTLKIRIFKHDVMTTYNLTSGGTPVASFKSPEYDFNVNEGVGYIDEEIIILDNDDTTSSTTFRYKVIEANISVNPGEVMAATMSYYPGNPWSPGDTLTSQSPIGNKLNRFDGIIDRDDTKTYQMGFFNSGLFILPDNRYGTGNFDNVFYPGQTFTNYLNVAMQFKLNATNVGINETAELGFAVGQNYPNPFSNQTIVEYALNAPTNVNLVVYDITGKSVAVINEGFKNVGNHKIEIDGSNLKSGVYYYTFRTDAGQTTKKMLIQR